MEVEETTELADEVELPAKSETGADDTTTPEENAEPVVKSGFGSLFEQARAKAMETQNSDDAETETDEELDADEKLPEQATEAEAEKAETEGETDEKPEAKKTSRSESFKKMEAERDAALTKSTEVENRLNTLDERFEKHGGVETVETAMELFDLAADKTKAKEFVEKINSLPHKAIIQKEIFENVLDLPANRVYGINRVLHEDFGLEANLTQPVLEKLFEFVTVRLNASADEFENFLERELELSDKSEKTQIEKLNAEIERLKSSPKEETKEPTQESEQEFATRIQRTYNEFEDQSFTKVSEPELKLHGFSVNPNDSPALKRAKERIASATKFAVAVEMREAKAHESLLDFWIEKTPEDNKFYSQAAKTYQKAMTIKVQNFLKDISPILGALKANPKQIPGTAITETAATGGKISLPLPKKEPTKPAGFGAAFSQARKRVGQS